MSPELEQKLSAEFPTVFPPGGMFQRYGVGCGDGWYDLIAECAAAIAAASPDVYAVQVKEKFGALRFYTALTVLQLAPDARARVNEAIDRATDRSIVTCERCGQPGKTQTPRNWILTLCDTHAAEEAARK